MTTLDQNEAREALAEAERRYPDIPAEPATFPTGWSHAAERAAFVEGAGWCPPLPAPSDVEQAIKRLESRGFGERMDYFIGKQNGDALRLIFDAARRSPVPADTPSEGEVLVEGSWFKRADLPEVLGNFMRSSAEYAREAKDALATLTELRPVREADTIALASRPTPPEDVAALSDADLWDFADDLLAARDIEDENPPSLSEQFRDMFVARFGKVAAVPADTPSEGDFPCCDDGEHVPAEIAGDLFTVTLNRAQWHRVDEALIAHGRNDAVRGQIAVTKIAARPTPPEDVATGRIPDLIRALSNYDAVNDDAVEEAVLAALDEVGIALAAVPADTPSGTSETTDQAGESDHDRSDDSPGPGRSALRFPRRTDLHGGVPVDPWREGADDGETRGSGRVVDGSSVLGLASGVALSQVPKAPSALTSLSRLTFPEDFAALIERARGWGWSGCSCGHRDCTGVADIEEATDAAVMLADLANRLAAALAAASIPDGRAD